MNNKVAYEKMEVALRPYDLAPFVPGVMLMLCVLGCLRDVLCFAMIMLCLCAIHVLCGYCIMLCVL
jgi:hypothetical protein